MCWLHALAESWAQAAQLQPQCPPASRRPPSAPLGSALLCPAPSARRLCLGSLLAIAEMKVHRHDRLCLPCWPLLPPPLRRRAAPSGVPCPCLL